MIQVRGILRIMRHLQITKERQDATEIDEPQNGTRKTWQLPSLGETLFDTKQTGESGDI